MKKWLIGCLMVLAMACLMGTAANAETVKVICATCNKQTQQEILQYVAKREGYQLNPVCHWVCYKCLDCQTEAWSSMGPGTAHTGGDETPTCTTGKTCEKCGGEYGILGHDWSEVWTPVGDGTHTRPCLRDGCDAIDTEICGGDNAATCVTPGTCTDCGGQYYIGHVFPARWNWETDTNVGRDAEKHWVRCLHCTEGKTCEGEHYFVQGNLDSCLKSEATCVSPPIYYMNCAICYYKGTETYEHPWGSPNPNKHDIVQYEAKAPTCTEVGWDAYEACQREGCTYSTYQEIPALNHDLVQHAAQSPTCLDIGWDAYETCSRCTYSTYQEKPALNHDLVQHDAQSPTCLDIGWDAYEACQREGCSYSTYQEIPALNHDEQEAIIPPTCEKDGYTLHTCSRCPDSYTTNTVTRLYHWFGEWSPNGDGTHSARCLRDGCYRVGTVKCQLFTADNALVCPVCGESSDGARLLRIESAAAEAVIGKLPAGELIARVHGDWFSIAFEHAGEITASTGIVRITLPAALVDGKILVYIAPDGAETALTAEIIGERACITLDFSEGAVWLIRLMEAV